MIATYDITRQNSKILGVFFELIPSICVPSLVTAIRSQKTLKTAILYKTYEMDQQIIQSHHLYRCIQHLPYYFPNER